VYLVTILPYLWFFLVVTVVIVVIEVFFLGVKIIILYWSNVHFRGFMVVMQMDCWEQPISVYVRT
jgi:hypothetical protein